MKNPENAKWSRYAAQLKNTDVVMATARESYDMIARVVDALRSVEAVEDVRDEEVRELLRRAEEELRQLGAID